MLLRTRIQSNTVSPGLSTGRGRQDAAASAEIGRIRPGSCRRKNTSNLPNSDPLKSAQNTDEKLLPCHTGGVANKMLETCSPNWLPPVGRGAKPRKMLQNARGVSVAVMSGRQAANSAVNLAKFCQVFGPTFWPSLAEHRPNLAKMLGPTLGRMCVGQQLGQTIDQLGAECGARRQKNTPPIPLRAFVEQLFKFCPTPCSDSLRDRGVGGTARAA